MFGLMMTISRRRTDMLKQKQLLILQNEDLLILRTIDVQTILRPYGLVEQLSKIMKKK